jgi:hypothetical protein
MQSIQFLPQGENCENHINILAYQVLLKALYGLEVLSSSFSFSQHGHDNFHTPRPLKMNSRQMHVVSHTDSSLNKQAVDLRMTVCSSPHLQKVYT